MEKFYTKLEYEIHQFVSRYGIDELLKWLSEYSKCISKADYNEYYRIQAAVCEIYNIPIADINRIGIRREFADAKRIISYLTSERTKLKPKDIARLQNITIRSVSNHISDIKFRIRNPNNFNEFTKIYAKILEKLQSYATRT